MRADQDLVWFIDGQRYRGDREAKALTRALAPYRSGRQGELRAHVRCMLVQLMGFARCEDIPTGIRKIPHWFPKRSGLESDEMYDMMTVAHDGLLELGYEAAAGALTRFLQGPKGGTWNIEVGAKEALENLESGPPSVMIASYPIITKSIRRYTNGKYLVGRNVNDGRWYRFARGKAIHNQRGVWVGWDDDAGYTFQRCGSTLEDIRAALYGSSDLHED